MTVKQIYDETIKPLPAPDRLRLAAIILNNIPIRLWTAATNGLMKIIRISVE